MLSERVYPTNFGCILSTENACLAREHQPLSRVESRTEVWRWVGRQRGSPAGPAVYELLGSDELFFAVAVALTFAIVGRVWLAHQNGSGEDSRAPGEVVPECFGFDFN